MSVDDNIHVLHIASGDLWAGAEVQLYTLARAQHSPQGIRVSAALLNHGRLEQKLRQTGINVIVIDESKLNGFQILRQLIYSIRKIDPDVIHTHRIKENILGSIAARLNGNIPSLRTAHGAPEHSPAWYHIPKRLIHFLDWFCGRFLQRNIIAVSQDLATILEKDFPAHKIHIIENGIELKSLTPHDNQNDARPTNEQRFFRIGIAGRLVSVKRVDLFIRTARQFIDEHPELAVSFHIYGDGPLRGELESLNHELQTGKHVHFEGHTDEIHTKLQELDLLMMTSDHEGLPMVLLEAMALRLPVIAHAVGGISNLLDRGSCGVLVDDHSPTGYADAIYRLIEDNENRVNITKNALARLAEHYSAENNAAAYRKKYEEILSLD